MSAGPVTGARVPPAVCTSCFNGLNVVSSNCRSAMNVSTPGSPPSITGAPNWFGGFVATTLGLVIVIVVPLLVVLGLAYGFWLHTVGKGLRDKRRDERERERRSAPPEYDSSQVSEFRTTTTSKMVASSRAKKAPGATAAGSGSLRSIQVSTGEHSSKRSVLQPQRNLDVKMTPNAQTKKSSSVRHNSSRHSTHNEEAPPAAGVERLDSPTASVVAPLVSPVRHKPNPSMPPEMPTPGGAQESNSDTSVVSREHMQMEEFVPENEFAAGVNVGRSSRTSLDDAEADTAAVAQAAGAIGPAATARAVGGSALGACRSGGSGFGGSAAAAAADGGGGGTGGSGSVAGSFNGSDNGTGVGGGATRAGLGVRGIDTKRTLSTRSSARRTDEVQPSPSSVQYVDVLATEDADELVARHGGDGSDSEGPRLHAEEAGIMPELSASEEDASLDEDAPPGPDQRVGHTRVRALDGQPSLEGQRVGHTRVLAGPTRGRRK